MPAPPSPPENPPPRRFRVALSYASERREIVDGVAKLLEDADTIGREAVLYDGFLGAEFDRFRLDGYLAELYRDECELIVVFLCPEYVKKKWCQLEWAYIKGLVAKPEDRRIMLLSVGSLSELERSALELGPGDYTRNVDGWFAAAIAQWIMDRLPPTSRSWTRDPRHDELKQLFERFQRECTEGAIVMASGIAGQRKGPKCTVEGAVPEKRISIVCEECMITHGGVANAGDVAKECASTDRRVSRAFGVVDECGRSSGRIETAGRII